MGCVFGNFEIDVQGFFFSKWKYCEILGCIEALQLKSIGSFVNMILEACLSFAFKAFWSFWSFRTQLFRLYFFKSTSKFYWTFESKKHISLEENFLGSIVEFYYTFGLFTYFCSYMHFVIEFLDHEH